MSLNIITGLMGAGKSYVAVNWILADELKRTERDIYTTLPVKVDKIARLVGGKSLAKQKRISERIHILKDEPAQVHDKDGNPIWKREPVLDEAGNVIRPGEPLELNQARCFWRFTRPNSLIIVDECADLWESGKYQATDKLGLEEGEFGVYLRQHRHYKDDLWMICHNLSDIDRNMRKKFHFVWTIANSRNEPIFDNAWFRNIRWPVQFFIVRQYTAADLKKPLDIHHVNPLASGFELYDSFSAASRLPGKELPDEGAKSADYKPSIMGRVKEFFRSIRKAALYLGMIFGGGYVIFFWVLAPALGWTSQKVQEKGRLPAPVAAGSPSPPLPSPVGSVPAAAGDMDALPVELPQPVRMAFRSPRFVGYSNGKKFYVGKYYDGKKLLGITDTGCIFRDAPFQPHSLGGEWKF